MRRWIGAVALLSAACSSSTSGELVPAGNWGSSQGSLTVTDSTSRLLVATGTCYGSYADVTGPIPIGNFALSGTFTQLIGAVPGSVQYPAQYSGTASNTSITVLITLPSQGRQIGPITVNYGVTTTLTPCLFP